jgi:hypothetical protein
MTAIIYQKAKNALQSGRAGTGKWVLEHEATEAKQADQLMGWSGSGDTRQQVKLNFATLDAATAYADSNGIAYRVVPAASRVIKMQAYADNFNVGPITPR